MGKIWTIFWNQCCICKASQQRIKGIQFMGNAMEKNHQGYHQRSHILLQKNMWLNFRRQLFPSHYQIHEQEQHVFGHDKKRNRIIFGKKTTAISQVLSLYRLRALENPFKDRCPTVDCSWTHPNTLRQYQKHWVRRRVRNNRFSYSNRSW